MEGTYEVNKNGQVVGRATVTREGMYYQIRCRCDLNEEGMFRLVIDFEDDRIDLGILVPDGKGFGLQTRINTKTLGQGSPAFSILPRRESIQHTVIKLCPEEPFRYLSRLEDAFLAKRNGEIFLCFHNEK